MEEGACRRPSQRRAELKVIGGRDTEGDVVSGLVMYFDGARKEEGLERTARCEDIGDV